LTSKERLFGYEHAFDHPVTTGLVIGVGVLLVVATALVEILFRAGKIDAKNRRELMLRCGSWWVLATAICVPILLGAAWAMLAVAVLSVLCYAEFARATGLFREKIITAVVVIGMIALTFAVVDNWYGFFTALPSLTVIILAAAAVISDRPQGYVQRFALGVMSFFLFGVCFAHLGFWTNDENFRPALLLLFAAVEMNDVFAYLCGRTLGRRKLAPETSPNKTVAGAAGALVLTTALVATLGHFVFRDTAIDSPIHLIVLGLIVSVGGQFGDLMLSSVKRDLGIKDMSSVIPGHGGFLDRFDSLILVAPATFHYVRYFQDIGVGQAVRIISGGG
jgi:phosphatidate cytidylyltransferase